jgi:hypothetical protein
VEEASGVGVIKIIHPTLNQFFGWLVESGPLDPHGRFHFFRVRVAIIYAEHLVRGGFVPIYYDKSFNRIAWAYIEMSQATSRLRVKFELEDRDRLLGWTGWYLVKARGSGKREMLAYALIDAATMWSKGDRGVME